MENLPATRSYIELEYQAIIQNMYKKMSDLQSAERIGRQEMKDYYSMWAHQIKTPIAAMKVLAQAAGDTEDACRFLITSSIIHGESLFENTRQVF